MKNIIKNSALLLMLSLAVGCDKEYVALDNASDAAWFTSETNKHPDAYRMNLGGVVSFMDASQGCKSHKWIIEDGSKFMVNDFDLKNKDYESQIDPNKGMESTNYVESVMFQKAGMTKVTLRDTFYEWVTAHDKNPVEAVLDLDNEEWVLTKEFAIDVYEDLKPAFKVYVNGEEQLTVTADQMVNGENSSKWPVIELGLGQDMTFEDMTGRNAAGAIVATGCRPTGAKWDVPNSAQTSITRNYDTSDGSIAESTKVNFSFNKMKPETGEYFTNFVVTSQRGVPAQNVKKSIPIKVKIVASTEEFEVKTDKIVIDPQESNIIKLSANGPFGTCGANAASSFAVSVTKEDGTDLGISIAGVEIDASSSFLNVVLTDKVYVGENVKISYDGLGDVVSVDGRTLHSFAEVQLPQVSGGSILDFTDYSFETIMNGGFATIGWSTINGVFITDKWVSQVARPEATATNQKAILFDIKDNTITNTAYYVTHTAEEAIPAGSYKVKLKVYIESIVKNNWDGLLQVKTLPSPTLVGSSADLSTLNTGEWIDLSFDFTVKTAMSKKFQIVFGAANKTAGQGTKFYVDDFELVPVRPQ